MSERTVHCADALAWLASNPSAEGMAVVTSMPDISELPHEKGTDQLANWKAWFRSAACAVVNWLSPGGVAIFYQSDIRYEGVWIDKGYLVARAVEETDAHLLWHKIVCRKPPGTIGLGRPSYSHMLAFRRGAVIPMTTTKSMGADVLPDAGPSPWSRGMGTDACLVACAYLRDQAGAHTVVDPFCGRGTILAVANDLKMNSIGIDISERRCRAARSATSSVIQTPGEPLRK